MSDLRESSRLLERGDRARMVAFSEPDDTKTPVGVEAAEEMICFFADLDGLFGDTGCLRERA